MQIVVINALDPDSLPPVATLPLVNTTPGEKKGRPGIPSNKPKDHADDSPKNKVRPALESEGPDYVPDKTECQPPILDTIKLVSGASIKTPAATQTGPKRLVDINHMTKRDHAKYLLKTASENVVTLGGGAAEKRSRAASKMASEAGPPNRLLQPTASSNARAAATNSPAAAASSPSGQTQQQHQQPLQQTMQQSLRQQSSAVGGNTALALLTEVTDAEQLKWLRDGTPKAKAAKGPQRPPSPPDPNLALLVNGDWGSTPNAKGKQPAQLPAKQGMSSNASKCFLACLLHALGTHCSLLCQTMKGHLWLARQLLTHNATHTLHKDNKTNKHEE